MNSSEIRALRPQIYNYLGFRNVGEDPKTDELIVSCLSEIERAAQFKYIFRSFSEPPEFLQKEPYQSFLSGSSGVIISAMTLGIGVDRLIKRLSVIDMAKGTVADCCASALIERLSDEYEDEYEKTIGDDLSYRFCPGYGGSSVNDLKYIFDILHPEKIGMSLSSSMFMLPSKSMAGVIAVGKRTEKTCKNCFMAGSCRYVKEGRRCYD